MMEHLLNSPILKNRELVTALHLAKHILGVEPEMVQNVFANPQDFFGNACVFENPGTFMVKTSHHDSGIGNYLTVIFHNLDF